MAKWLIWSNEHGAWWKSNGQGYTYYYDEAGEYTPDEKDKILRQANIATANQERPDEVAILVVDAES